MIIVLILLALLIGAYWYTYPRMGLWLYKTGNSIESKLYGFTKTSIEVNGIYHSVWQSKNRDKPTLLLIHGFSASYSVWLRFAKHFTTDYNVVIPDLAGHGETGFKPEWDYSIESQCTRLEGLLDQLSIDKAHIIGNSMGGFIAAHFGRFHEQRCLSITLIDPAGVSSPNPSPMLEMLMDGQNPFLVDNREQFRAFYAMTMERPPFVPNSVIDALAEVYIARKEELAKIFGDYNRQHNYLETELDKITCPSLLIWGAHDKLIDVSSVAVWESGLNCETHVWYDVGHMPMMEAPERTAFAVKQFLSR